jgi:hypothetical protein
LYSSASSADPKCIWWAADSEIDSVAQLDFLGVLLIIVDKENYVVVLGRLSCRGFNGFLRCDSIPIPILLVASDGRLGGGSSPQILIEIEDYCVAVGGISPLSPH